MESLAAAREERAFLCRLTPDRALGSLDEADAFLRDRGMLTRTSDSALPSLYEACHEEAYKPGSPGFATWPATKWPWFGELAERGYLIVAVHRGKNLLVSGDLACILDPICRAEIARMRAAHSAAARLLDHLARVGPSGVEDLRVELRMKRQELNSLRAPMERCGVLVSRSLHVTAGRGNRIPASWRAGTRCTRDRAEPTRGRGRRSGTSWPPAFGPAWSRPSVSCGAGSPGCGTGPIRSSMTWSATDAPAGWTGTSSRPASRGESRG